MRELVDQHRISEIDPAWLSLYFMVCYFACTVSLWSTPCRILSSRFSSWTNCKCSVCHLRILLQVLACGLFYSPNRPDMPAGHQAEYTHTWVIGAQRALQLADWSGKPQLTCIQSVVLFPIVLMHAGGIKRLSSWIAAALRMAQLLDLHKLDDETGQHGKSGGGGSSSASNGTASGTSNNHNAARRSGAASTLSSVEKEIGKRELCNDFVYLTGYNERESRNLIIFP